jgi:hypothetical protein
MISNYSWLFETSKSNYQLNQYIYISFHIYYYLMLNIWRVRRGRDGMLVVFTNNCPISAYPYWFMAGIPR